jgi:hypothetical protein
MKIMASGTTHASLLAKFQVYLHLREEDSFKMTCWHMCSI